MTDFAALRQRLVDNQIRPSEITDHALIKAFLAVPRERFVTREERPFAYSDRELQMSEDAPDRKMIDPVQLARLIQALSLAPRSQVMVIGGGSGYSAAILSRLAGSVALVEETPLLAEMARERLREIGADNVTVIEAPLMEGHAGGAPYEAILLDGSVETVPERLVAQLRPGGMLAAVERRQRISQAVVYERTASGPTSWPLFEAWAAPLPGFLREREFVF